MAKRKERSIISIIGRTNVGKSSLLNLLSGQKNYAIVDKTPGTTADTVITQMEIHDLGPFKILDTAGVDEFSELGNKKRQKTYEAIEEADLNLITIDLLQAIKEKNLNLEKKLIHRIQRHKKQGLILYNLFENEKIPPTTLKKFRRQIDKKLNSTLPSLTLKANNQRHQRRLVDFIKTHYKKENRHIDLLPNIKNQGYVLLIIPMDEETPTLRLLRPQDMAIERLLRNFAIPVLYRLDLKKARGGNSTIAHENPPRSQNSAPVRKKLTPDQNLATAAEKNRFLNLLQHLSSSPEKLQLIITDSQALDIVSQWTPKKIPLTSFSIMMANYMSFGNLNYLIESVKTIDNLKPQDHILIAEACNHNRKCNDIGTVQIPRLLEKKVGGKLNFDFSFGRPFPDNLNEYRLIVHCGACMIDRQKYLRRLHKAQTANVPFTNYGLLLSYIRGKNVLNRVLKPFLTPHS